MEARDQLGHIVHRTHAVSPDTLAKTMDNERGLLTDLRSGLRQVASHQYDGLEGHHLCEEHRHRRPCQQHVLRPASEGLPCPAGAHRRVMTAW